MRTRLLKRLLTTGAVTLSAALVVSTGVASASQTTGTAPRFNTTNGVQQVRAAGSETTYYLMNALGSLYTQTSIYGCILSTTDNRTCTTSDGPIDTQDDWSRTEFDNGAGVGSGKGIAQLCGAPTGGLVTDFARSSRAIGSGDLTGSCNSSNLIPLNYADDAVVPVDFQNVGKTQIGTTTPCPAGVTAAQLESGSCQLGPLAAGWVPGDTLAGPYHGQPFNNITTVGGTSSLAQRIYHCSGVSSPITDWGQLTNLGTPPTLAVGSGTPIGVPIYLPFVNTGSGTYSTWKGVVGCDPNPGSTVSDGQTAQENDAPQMSDLAYSAGQKANGVTARWPDYSASTSTVLSGTPLTVYSNNETAATFYYMSLGVSNWRPYTGTVTVPNAQCTSSCSKSASTQLSVDNVTQTPSCDYASNACFDNSGASVTQSNSARKLFNIVRSDTLRGSTAGFMNWICDANVSSEYGTDLTTGKSYANEIIGTIGTTFGFPYQACTTDGSGNSTTPLVAPGTTPPTGGAAVPAANVGT